MSVTIVIPTPLRQFAGGKSEIEVDAVTAGGALEALTATHADLRKHLYNEQDNLRNFINVYVGDEDIRHLDGPGTAVKDGETIMIVPSIAGGNYAAEARAADDALPELTSDEYARYSRHLILPEVGLEGQRKLKNARVRGSRHDRHCRFRCRGRVKSPTSDHPWDERYRTGQDRVSDRSAQGHKSQHKYRSI